MSVNRWTSSRSSGSSSRSTTSGSPSFGSRHVSEGQPPAVHSADNRPAGLKILAIDDSPLDRRLLVEELRDVKAPVQGVVTANCLTEGLAKALDERFDVILLDFNLPDCRAWEGLERLRALPNPVPVILLTGADDAEAARESLRRGAQDYLIKGQVAGASILHAIEFAIERQGTVDELSRITRTDPLTGIANRLNFGDHLDHALRHALRFRHRVALHSMDLDRFKEVNDTLGHQVGDGVLRESARRLTAATRAVDFLFRLGGDEFGLIQTDLADRGGAEVLVDKLMRQFVTPMRVESHELVIGISIGSAIYPDDADDAHELIAKADAALYRAKELHGSSSTFT